MIDKIEFKSKIKFFPRAFYLLLLIVLISLPVIFLIAKPTNVNLPLVVLFSVLSAFILVLWFKYFKKTYSKWYIIANELHLTYWNSKVVIPLNKIQKVNFNASIKVSLFLYITRSEDGVEISYNGQKYFICKEDFWNLEHLCRYLETKVNGKLAEDFEITKPKFVFNEETFVLNRWGIFSLISMFGYFPFLCLFCLGFFANQFWSLWPIHIALALIGIAISAHFSNYIRYNSEMIQIKNAIFKKYNNYLFTEILAAKIYAQSNSDSEVLELTLKDYSVRRYHINSLSYDESRKLSEVFKSQGIIIKGKFA